MSTLKQIMTTTLQSIPESTSVANAAQLMRDEKIGSLLVQKNGDYVGILTETDVVRRAVASGTDLGTVRVGTIMSSPIAKIEHFLSVRDAQDMMGDLGVRHLAVYEADKIVGLISVRDLLVYYRSYSEPKITQD